MPTHRRRGRCRVLYCFDVARAIDLVKASTTLQAARRTEFHHKGLFPTGGVLAAPLRLSWDAAAPEAGCGAFDPDVESLSTTLAQSPRRGRFPSTPRSRSSSASRACSTRTRPSPAPRARASGRRAPARRHRQRAEALRRQLSCAGLRHRRGALPLRRLRRDDPAQADGAGAHLRAPRRPGDDTQVRVPGVDHHSPDRRRDRDGAGVTDQMALEREAGIGYSVPSV